VRFTLSLALKSLKQPIACICLQLLFFAACAPVTRADSGQSEQNSSADLRQLSLEQLGNVEITSVSKEPEEVWNTAAAIYVLTQDDIRRSGATSIPEVLRLVPGVEVARIDSDHWAVGIRGFGSEFSRSVLVLIDGRSVYTPLFSGVYWNVQNVMLEDVDRIEVIRGPGGTIWGANAVNGVINIITKSAKDTHGALVSTLAGNVDQGEGHFRFGGGNGRGFDYRVYGMAFGRAAEFHPDNVNFDEWQMGQGGFRTDWQSADNRDTFTIQGDMYKGYDGERVQVALYSPPSVLTFNDPHNVSGGNLNATWRHQISDTSDFRVQSYYDRTSRLSPQLNEIRNTLDVDFLYHLNWRGRQDILLGAGGRWSPDTIQQKFATLDFVPQQETDSIYSWFAQDQISIVPKKLLLTLGSKFEHNNYSGFDVQPNGRLLWAPDDHNSFWVAVTRAVRTPDRLDQDLQLTDFLLPGAVPTFLRVLGSTKFTSEEMLGTEVGYRTLLVHKLYVDTTYFHNSYNHLYGYGVSSVFLEPTPAPLHAVLEFPLANATAGDTQGVEIAPDWKPLTWFELKGSYSYLHLQVHSSAGVAGQFNSLVTVSDNGSSPHHQIEMQSLFDLPKHFEFDATFRFVSALPAQTSTPAGPTVQAYNTGDARFAWHAIPGLEISMVGQNLFQPDHPEFGGDDGPLVGIRRSYYGKVTWTTPQ
jgi:iron complex outermembrane receptor protein